MKSNSLSEKLIITPPKRAKPQSNNSIPNDQALNGMFGERKYSVVD